MGLDLKIRLIYLYNENGEMECLRTEKTKEEAKEKYKLLHEKYGCTIWIQKIEFVNPKDL